MRRQIEFRGKELEYGYWVYGYFVDYNPIPSIRRSEIDDNDYDYLETEIVYETLGQFICMDKKNVKIFEGDKVNILSRSDVNNPNVFFYSDKGVLKVKNNFGEFHISELDLRSDNLDVIGNIHDN